VKTLKEYESLFDGSSGLPAVGEASQRYSPDAYALEAIARHLPEVKLVFFLRKPVERAWLHFVHFRRYGGEACATLLGAIKGADPMHQVYTRTGFYAHRLAKWYERFDVSNIWVARRLQRRTACHDLTRLSFPWRRPLISTKHSPVSQHFWDASKRSRENRAEQRHQPAILSRTHRTKSQSHEDAARLYAGLWPPVDSARA